MQDFLDFPSLKRFSNPLIKYVYFQSRIYIAFLHPFLKLIILNIIFYVLTVLNLIIHLKKTLLENHAKIHNLTEHSLFKHNFCFKLYSKAMHEKYHLK